MHAQIQACAKDRGHLLISHVFTNGIFSSAARTESLSVVPDDLQSAVGNFVVKASSTVSVDVVINGTLRIDGSLVMGVNTTLQFLNGSLFVAGTLALSPGSSISLPNGVALVGNNSILELTVGSTVTGNASSVTIPVLAFGLISAELNMFSRVNVTTTEQGQCVMFRDPQQVVTSSSLSVTLTVERIHGCFPNSRLSDAAVIGISIACVAIAVLVGLSVVALTRLVIANRTAQMPLQLQEKSLRDLVETKEETNL